MKLCLHNVGKNFYYLWLKKVDSSMSSKLPINNTNITRMRRLIYLYCDLVKTVINPLYENRII